MRRVVVQRLSSLAVATLVALAAPLAAAADAWSVERLMRELGGRSAGEARFVERKHLAILEQPVVSSGELRYRAPDRLEKITVKPKPESLVLEGDRLTVERGGKRHVVQLAEHPEVAAFVGSIRATLAGDRAALERTYALSLGGSESGWSLSLLPRDPRMAEIVLRITITGRRAELATIEILQADGDRSVMEITPR